MLLDKIVCGVLTFIVRTLLCPKVYFVDESQKKAVVDGPAIFVCNHTGHLDGGIVNVVFHRNKIHSLAAKDRFEQKFFGFLLRHTGCIPIDRMNADTSWIHESLKVLNDNRECVAIYPEGKHGGHRRLLPFHPGVSMLAIMARVPIVMVYLDGPFNFFHRSGLIVGRPFMIDLPSEGLSSDFVNSQTEVLQEKMRILMEEYVRRNGE